VSRAISCHRMYNRHPIPRLAGCVWVRDMKRRDDGLYTGVSDVCSMDWRCVIDLECLSPYLYILVVMRLALYIVIKPLLSAR